MITLLVGPNFMKIAPIYRESLQRAGADCRIVQTGPHNDYEMSQAFFDDSELREPAFFFDASLGTRPIRQELGDGPVQCSANADFEENSEAYISTRP